MAEPLPPPSSPQLPAGAPVGADPNGLSLDAARAFLVGLAAPALDVESVGLHAALGRVLAHDVLSDADVPAHDNSAMDGYALRHADLDPAAPTTLREVGVALAGQPFEAAVPPRGCVRITTGALLPTGLDTVAPVELVSVHAAAVQVPPAALGRGDNRRRAGEDIARGDVALGRGRVLRPADLGLLASLGRGAAPVWRRLRVAFFSTGNELRSIGQPLPPGCVYDSNRYTLWGMLDRLGVEPIDLGVVADDPAALEAALRQAAHAADAVITTGGVSGSEADHVRQVMGRLGEVWAWRLAIRPGRPMALGRIVRDQRSTWVFGLPGNPVAVMVTFYALVRDALLGLSGAAPAPLPTLRAQAAQRLRKKAGRTEFLRAILAPTPQGHWQVRTTGAQGSGILRSMSQANALVVLEHARGDVECGEWVDVWPFDALV